MQENPPHVCQIGVKNIILITFFKILSTRRKRSTVKREDGTNLLFVNMTSSWCYLIIGTWITVFLSQHLCLGVQNERHMGKDGSATSHACGTGPSRLPIHPLTGEWGWTPFSVRPSVRLSVCHTFHYVPLIVSSWNFQLLPLTKVMSMQEVKVSGQRSRSQRSKPNLAVSGFSVTPDWVHIWLRNEAQSLKWHKRGAVLLIKVIYQISRSHGTKNRRFWPKLRVSGL